MRVFWGRKYGKYQATAEQKGRLVLFLNNVNISSVKMRVFWGRKYGEYHATAEQKGRLVLFLNNVNISSVKMRVFWGRKYGKYQLLLTMQKGNEKRLINIEIFGHLTL
jgi:hypothetical protein